MPTNLSIEAQLAWSEYLDAKSLDDRIIKLEKFLSSINRHKGNENVVAVNKTRLSQLKEEKAALDAKRKSVNANREDAFLIKKDSQFPQVALISDFFDLNQGGGVGKTSLIRNLTDVPDGVPGIFTPEPIVGIHTWQKVKFQIVDVPSIHESTYVNRALNLVRTTDLIALCIDLSRDPLLQMENLIRFMGDASVYPNRVPANVKVEKAGSGGVQIFYISKSAEECEFDNDFVKELAKAAGLANVTVKIFGKVSVDDMEIAFNKSSVFPPAFVIGTKADAPGSKQNFQILKEKYGIDVINKISSQPYFEIHPVALKSDESGKIIRTGLANLGEILLKTLKYLRIFTRSKNGVADRPLLMPFGSTVGDVALKIHKTMYNTFKYASIYRETGQQRKIRAGLNFPVEDFDVVEIFSNL